MFLIIIFQTILWSYVCHYMYSIIDWQFVYYYIITYYLKFFNKILRNLINSSIFVNNKNILAIIENFHQIYKEINEYNNNYWSKFLCIIWLNISVIIACICSLALFLDNILIFKIAIIPLILYFISILIFIIRISAAIYIESNNSYQLFNSLFCLIRYRTVVKFKVIFKYLLLINI